MIEATTLINCNIIKLVLRPKMNFCSPALVTYVSLLLCVDCLHSAQYSFGSKLSKSVISQLCAVCSQQSFEGQWGPWVFKETLFLKFGFCRIWQDDKNTIGIGLSFVFIFIRTQAATWLGTLPQIQDTRCVTIMPTRIPWPMWKQYADCEEFWYLSVYCLLSVP